MSEKINIENQNQSHLIQGYENTEPLNPTEAHPSDMEGDEKRKHEIYLAAGKFALDGSRLKIKELPHETTIIERLRIKKGVHSQVHMMRAMSDLRHGEVMAKTSKKQAKELKRLQKKFEKTEKKFEKTAISKALSTEASEAATNNSSRIPVSSTRGSVKARIEIIEERAKKLKDNQP